MRYRGRLVDPPYEDVAVEKMHTIVAAHPVYFDALAVFVRDSNARLDVFVGNHDVFLAWPGVQEVLRVRLAGADAALRGRIRFFDTRRRFELVEHGALYYHGHNADVDLRIDPERTIVPPEETGLAAPILNMPYGSYLVSDLLAVVKQRNVLVGRSERHREVLHNAVRYRWGWMAWSAYAFLVCMIRHTLHGLSLIHI